MSPMRSKSQRAFLWANHPKVAAKFERETPKGKKLPSHADDANRRRKSKKS